MVLHIDEIHHAFNITGEQKKNKSNAVWDISTDSTYLGAPHAQMNNRLSRFRFLHI